MLPLSKSESFRQTKIWALIFLAAECLSWLSFNFLDLELQALIGLGAAVLLLSVWRTQFMILLPLAELVWGSLGHSFQYGLASSRLVIFTSICLAFLIRYGYKLFRLKFWSDGALVFFWILSLGLVGMGVWLASIRDINLFDIYQDSNAYLYILLLPIWYQVYRSELATQIISIIMAAGLITAIKTILLFNIFVHDYSFLDTATIYKWVRDLRTGEITPFANSFTRVFMQSQLYVLIGLVFGFARQLRDYRSWKNFAAMSIMAASLYISLSRSFWLGLAIALIIMLLLTAIYHHSILPMYVYIFLIAVAVGGLALVEIFYNIPKYHNWNIFTQRTASLEESAANSRLQLLEPLWNSIKEKPILGHGFGKEVTYESYDPRIRNESNPTGLHTTYAFEWGWLDQWAKLGIFYILVFLGWLLLIFGRLYKMLSERFVLSLSCLAALAAVMVIHIFSPYLNHPLGLGLVVLASVISSKNAAETFGYN